MQSLNMNGNLYPFMHNNSQSSFSDSHNARTHNPPSLECCPMLKTYMVHTLPSLPQSSRGKVKGPGKVVFFHEISQKSHTFVLAIAQQKKRSGVCHAFHLGTTYTYTNENSYSCRRIHKKTAISNPDSGQLPSFVLVHNAVISTVAHKSIQTSPVIPLR